jgi:hypothetical protein
MRLHLDDAIRLASGGLDLLANVAELAIHLGDVRFDHRYMLVSRMQPISQVKELLCIPRAFLNQTIEQSLLLG